MKWIELATTIPEPNLDHSLKSGSFAPLVFISDFGSRVCHLG